MSTAESSTAAPTQKPSETYIGSCHCGNFKYRVTQSPPLSDPESSVTQCNCSICARNGYLLIYVPDSSVAFENGSFEDMTVGPTFSHSTSSKYASIANTWSIEVYIRSEP